MEFLTNILNVIRGFVSQWLTVSMQENIVSEIVGIAITVFLVDRVIARRERKRWKPARQLLNAKIFSITSDFLNKVSGAPYKNFRELCFRFGTSPPIWSPEYNGKASLEIYDWAKKAFVVQSLLGEPYDATSLSNAHEKISAILSTVTFFEPETYQLILDFEGCLNNLLQVVNMPEPYWFYAELNMISVLNAGIDLHYHLGVEADEKQTPEQFNTQIQNALKKHREALPAIGKHHSTETTE